MDDLTRRDAVKLAAAGAAFTGLGLSGSRAEAQAGQQPEAYRDRASTMWADHKTASQEDLKDLFRQTQPVPASLGIDPPNATPAVAMDAAAADRMKADFTPMGSPPLSAAWSGPRPDLNGLRVKLPNAPEIYLIDEGYRRWIPDPATYNNLFRDWNGIVVDIDINAIPLSMPISSGAILARGNGTAPVFLISNGVKRWITSPAAMDKYYFAWNRVYVVPVAFVNSIPNGSNIS